MIIVSATNFSIRIAPIATVIIIVKLNVANPK